MIFIPFMLLCGLLAIEGESAFMRWCGYIGAIFLATVAGYHSEYSDPFAIWKCVITPVLWLLGAACISEKHLNYWGLGIILVTTILFGSML